MSVAAIKYDKLTVECRKCKRLIYNGGSCGGRNGILNICLAYKPDERKENWEFENRYQDEKNKLQKGFALACRFIGDNFGSANLGSNDEDGEELLTWQEYFIDIAENEKVCRVCGCTENNACLCGCYWVEEDLCSACAKE